jgi:hypothetical protein
MPTPSSNTRRAFVRILGLALIVSALSFACAAGPALGHGLMLAEECGYSGCHDGAPIPGTETSAAVETTCVPGKPSVSSKVRVRKAARVTGTLSPAPSVATTISVYYERKVGRTYKAWSHVNIAVAAGAKSFTARPKFPKRGSWRVRALHVEASGAKSKSAWRTFKVR